MASSANLELVISLKDQASKGLGGISKSVGALGTAVGVFAGGAALAGVTALGRAVGDFFSDAITESRDAAKGFAQTEAAIKSTGGAANVTAGQIVEYAGALSKSTLFTDDAIQGAENLLLTFTNVANQAGAGNDIFNQTTQIGLDMAQALGTDAAGGMIQLGKAMNDPTKGISALTRVGVTFTEQQKNQIKTMQASGDLMGAQKIILAELTKEFGGSAVAAAQADGGFHLFQQRMDDVKQSIGDRLQPALQSLMGFMAGPGMDAVEKLAEKLGGALSTAVTWLTTTGLPNAIIGFSGLWNSVKVLITGDFKGGIFGLSEDSGFVRFLLKVHEIGEGAFTIIKEGIKGLASGDFSQLKLDATAIFGPDGGTAITETLQKLREGWGLARDSVITFKEALAGDWKNAENINPLHQAVGTLGVVARGAFGWLVETGLPNLKAGFDASMPGNIKFVDDLATSLGMVKTKSDDADASVKGFLDWGFDPNVGIALWLNNIMTGINKAGLAINRFFNGTGAAWSIFYNTVQTVNNKVVNAITTMQNAVGTAFTAISGWLRTLDTTVFTFATNVSTTIRGAATTVWSTFYGAVQTAHTNVVNAVSGIVTAVITMASTIGTKIDEAVTLFTGFPGRASAAVSGLGTLLVSAGASLVQGLIDGISSKFAAVQSTLAGLTKLLPSWKGPPATDAALLFASGKLIIQGLIDGFGAMTPAVKDKLKSITDAISATFDAGSKGVDFFGKLAGFKAPSAGNIDAFTAAAAAMIKSLGTAAQAFKTKWLEQATVFFDAAGKGLGIVSSAIDGLAKLRTFKAPSVAAVNAFTDTVMLIVQSLGSAAQVFKEDWLTHAQLFFDTSGKGLGIIGSGVEGLMKLRDFKAPTLTAINAFTDTAILVVQTLGTAAQVFKEKWLAQASIFFDAATKGLGVIGAGIEGLAKLRTFRAPAMAAVAAFGDTLVFVVQTMNDIAKFFNAGTLAKTAIAADAIGKIISPITAAIEALSSVKNYKGIAAAAFRLLAQDIDGVIQTMVIIAAHVTAEGITAAAAFGDAVGSVMAGLKSTLDTFKDLNAYKGVAPKAVKLLISDLYGVIGTLQGFFASAGGAMQDADAWQTTMEAVAGAVQSGVDALNAIADVKDVGSGIQAFAAGLAELGTVFTTAFVTLMDTVLLPWQEATRAFFGAAGFGFIGAASVGIMSAGGGLAQMAGSVGGAAGSALASGLQGSVPAAVGAIGTIQAAINALKDKTVTITIRTVHEDDGGGGSNSNGLLDGLRGIGAL